MKGLSEIVMKSLHKDEANQCHIVGHNRSDSCQHAQGKGGSSPQSCIEGHNFRETVPREGRDDEAPKQLSRADLDYSELMSFHNRHTTLLGDATLQQLHALEISIPDPPFACRWDWCEDQFILTQQKGNDRIDTGIYIQPSYKGTYTILLGDRVLLDVETLRHALYIAETVAHAFLDQLPAKRVDNDAPLSYHIPELTG